MIYVISIAFRKQIYLTEVQYFHADGCFAQVFAFLLRCVGFCALLITKSFRREQVNFFIR